MDAGEGKERETGVKSVDTRENSRGKKDGHAKRCGKAGHKSVKCPDKVCGVCGGKGRAVEVCANIVSVSSRAKLRTSLSVVKERKFSSVMHKASFLVPLYRSWRDRIVGVQCIKLASGASSRHLRQ